MNFPKRKIPMTNTPVPNSMKKFQAECIIKNRLLKIYVNALKFMPAFTLQISYLGGFSVGRIEEE